MLRGPKFAGASPPAAHDQDLIGKSVARRRQAIAGAMERATPLPVCCWIWSPWHGELLQNSLVMLGVAARPSEHRAEVAYSV